MKCPWAHIAICLATSCCTSFGGDELKYDFRATSAFTRLSAEQKAWLEHVNADLALLKEALQKYAKEHDGRGPKDLESLVPRYVAVLPQDPFATTSTASQEPREGVASSLGGWGYALYENSFFVGVSSVGLPDFPYGAERSYGLHCSALVKPSWAPKGIRLIQEEEELRITGH